MDFHMAGPGRAFEQMVYVCRAIIRQTQDGLSVGGP